MEMDGMFFILALGIAFIFGVLFIGYFEQGKDDSLVLSQNYLNGAFTLQYAKDDNKNIFVPLVNPSALEEESFLEIVDANI